MAEPIDLSTTAGRRRARFDLHWGDHGFLRLRFRNLHRISDEMYRANQPSPEHIGRYARELGLKTIINLRGKSPKGYYLLEKEACHRHGVDLVDFQVFSRDAPARDSVLAARDLFQSIAYPALMHCKSGADRAGLMAVLYMHFRQGLPIEEARKQLSFKYLHIREGKTGVLDFFFETYLKEGKPANQTFAEWVASSYDRATVKAEFLRTWKQKLNLDQLLQRE
ncbi:MAG: protein tyrosine phosphatase [Alphaproteobacteria bacterium]|nr:protein tyrosine phosphatase [Alphaproteobacteria bacterium]